MNFSSYQKSADKTAMFKGVQKEQALLYVTLGVAGEVGELVNKVKKIIRDDAGTLTKEKATEIQFEAGDVLWYLSQIARLTGSSIEKIADMNIKKLQERTKRGTISGAGDHR